MAREHKSKVCALYTIRGFLRPFDDVLGAPSLNSRSWQVKVGVAALVPVVVLLFFVVALVRMVKLRS